MVEKTQKVFLADFCRILLFSDLLPLVLSAHRSFIGALGVFFVADLCRTTFQSRIFGLVDFFIVGVIHLFFFLNSVVSII